MEGKHVLASLLIFVVTLSSLGFVFASSNMPPGAPPPSAGGKITFSREGQYKAWLTHAITSYSDRGLYKVTLTTSLDLTMIVIDCCIQGDTIAVFNPGPTGPKVWSATSPVIIDETWELSAGTYNFYVGYEVSAMFPAGYYIYFITSQYGGGYPAPPKAG